MAIGPPTLDLGSASLNSSSKMVVTAIRMMSLTACSLALIRGDWPHANARRHGQSGFAHHLLGDALGLPQILLRDDRLAVPTRPRRRRGPLAGLALGHRMGGDLCCQPGGLCFPRLADQHPLAGLPHRIRRSLLRTHLVIS